MSRGGDNHAVLEQIRNAPAAATLYIVLHNIDGPGWFSTSTKFDSTCLLSLLHRQFAHKLSAWLQV